MSDALFIKRNRPLTTLSEVSKTRPADTATYAAGDVVNESTSAGTVWTFNNMARGAGLGGVIQSAILVSSLAPPTLKGEFELYLFDTAPGTQNDNVAWAPSDAEAKKIVAMIPFSLANYRAFGANNGAYMLNALGITYDCSSTLTTLSGILVARNAYVPGNAEELTIRLFVNPD